MHNNGSQLLRDGTSLAAPYIAGIFAVACQSAGNYCNTAPTSDIYAALRNTGTLNTVRKADGTALPAGTTSRFIRQQW